MRKSMLHGIELESLDPGVMAINPWRIFKYSDNLTKAKHAQLHAEKGNANFSWQPDSEAFLAPVH